LAFFFSIKSQEEMVDLKRSMVLRVEKGLDPLELAILLLDDQILDGRHRDQAWMELADEGACGGYFKTNMPRVEKLNSSSCAITTAWLKVSDRNNGKQSTASQRAVGLLLAAEKYPELQALIDTIASASAARQVKGKPVGTSSQRGTTAAQVGKMAGVGSTIVKQAQRLQREAPEKLKDVAEGKMSLKKALADVGKTNPQNKQKPALKSVSGMLLNVHSTFAPYIPINDIAAQLKSKAATMKVILTVTVTDQDGNILGEGAFKELVDYEWEDGPDPQQCGVNCKPADAPNTNQNGAEVPKIEDAPVQLTDNDEFFYGHADGQAND
jgi:hypothetical protein